METRLLNPAGLRSSPEDSELGNLFVVLAGQFPPPVHGLAYITKCMAGIVAGRHETATINLSPHMQRGGIAYHLYRLMLLLRGLPTLLRHSRKKSRVLYTACEGNFGILYIAVLLLVGRALRYRLYIHHHSFRYVDARHRVMAWLIAIAGPQAVHIFLCDLMGRRFATRYGKTVKGVVLSNSAFVDLGEYTGDSAVARSQSLTIGLISNLNNGKGLDIFLDLVRAAIGRGLDLRSILAGPAAAKEDADRIKAACAELGPILDYRGPLYGREKKDFFDEIDVFVFPTRHIDEAQPVVVFEALAHGKPVLSYRRGCICEQLETGGTTISVEKDFISFALDELAHFVEMPAKLKEMKQNAKAAFLNERSASLQIVSRLFLVSPILFPPTPSP